MNKEKGSVVLIVEDNPDHIDLFVAMCHRFEVEHIVTNRGFEAAAMIMQRSGPFNFILCDRNLGRYDLNGPQVLGIASLRARVRQDCEEIPKMAIMSVSVQDQRHQIRDELAAAGLSDVEIDKILILDKTDDYQDLWRHLRE